MNGQPVDVLAVLSRVIDGDDVDTEVELMRVRSAVAELIEALRAGREVQTHNGPVLRFDELQSERLAAALAGVSGVTND